jgi:hypothetical protein
MKQYTFVLNFGYVESSSLSYLPFSSTDKYRDAKEALIDLAEFLKEQYLLQHETKPKKCCIASKEKDATAEFCPKCGHSLTKEEFNDEHFTQWLSDMECANIDSFHGEFIDYDESHPWQYNGLEGALNQRFVYQAEWVIAAALGYPHRKEQTFEKICQDRTKTKRESFSYY